MNIFSKFNKFIFSFLYLSFSIILASCGGSSGGTSGTSSTEIGTLSNGSAVYVSSDTVDVKPSLAKQNVGSLWLSGGNSNVSYAITFANQVTNSNSISSIESNPISIEPCYVGTAGSNLSDSCNLEVTISKSTPSGVYQMVPTATGNDASRVSLNPITIVVNNSTPSNNSNSITYFALNGIPGVISGSNISVTVPSGTNVTALVAAFVTTGSSVSVNGVVQVNNTTPNNFTNSVVYTVTASDGTTQSYTVNVAIASSNANSITSFALNGIPGVISGSNISVTMPYGTNVTALVASFVTTGIGVSVNGVAQVNNTTPNNFTNPVVYTVTASNGTIQSYTVNVAIASASANSIMSFALNGVPGVISGNNISVTMPSGTNVTALVAAFVTTGTSISIDGVTQINNVTANNFTNSVVYTVTAANGTAQNYTVNVAIASASANSILQYSINGISGIISGNNIFVTMPSGTNVTALVGAFVTTGVSVSVNGTLQINNVTSNNFTNSVVYTVTAANGTIQNYTVNVAIAGSSANSITSFALNGISGVVSGNNISVTMPFGTNVTALIANYISSGQYVTVNGVIQQNTVTANDFTSSVVYTVTAANGAVQNYTVTVTIASDMSKLITEFSLNGSQGVISGTNILVTVPAKTNLTNLVASFVTTGTMVTVNGAVQTSGVTVNDFTNPVTYTVTAADGTMQMYKVTVKTASDSAKAFTFFALNGIPGDIVSEDGLHGVIVNVPSAAGVNLIASYTTTGILVTVNGIIQQNAITVNDFSEPLEYVVTAEDGTTRTYWVGIGEGPLK